jgi:hypothetical protein
VLAQNGASIDVRHTRRAMNIYGTKNNIYDAVDAVVEHGVAAVEGTKTPAVDYANRIIKCLSVYSGIEPAIGYKNVANEGYLYYVYDINRFPIGSAELEAMINQFDEANS